MVAVTRSSELTCNDPVLLLTTGLRREFQASQSAANEPRAEQTQQRSITRFVDEDEDEAARGLNKHLAIPEDH
jgi:hypothetical protein